MGVEVGKYAGICFLLAASSMGSWIWGGQRTNHRSISRQRHQDEGVLAFGYGDRANMEIVTAPQRQDHDSPPNVTLNPARNVNGDAGKPMTWS